MISLTAALGLFVHDTQLGNMAITAITMPSIVADYNTGDVKLRPNLTSPHTDINSFSEITYNLRSQQPASRPRNEDDKKYIVQKRLTGNSFGNEYSWPSI